MLRIDPFLVQSAVLHSSRVLLTKYIGFIGLTIWFDSLKKKLDSEILLKRKELKFDCRLVVELRRVVNLSE